MRDAREKKFFTTESLVTMAILIAMNIILSRFLSVSAWNIKIGFTFLTLVIAAVRLGPLQAGAVGAVGDFLGAIMFPIGPYFPGFTITAFLTGIVFGIFLQKGCDLKHIIPAVVINEVVGSLLLNTLWISILYGASFSALFATRIIQVAVMMVVESVMIKGISFYTRTRAV